MCASQPTPCLTRADLAGLPARLLRAGASYKADVRVYRLGGEAVVLKDYADKKGFWRHVVGVIGSGLEASTARAQSGMSRVSCTPSSSIWIRSGSPSGTSRQPTSVSVRTMSWKVSRRLTIR